MKRRREFPQASWYTDRHGKRRWRYRHKGLQTELGTEYGSDEFVRRYEAAELGHRDGVGRSRTTAGSLNALVASWYQSPGFRRLSPNTQTVYRGVVDRLREEHGDKRVAKLEQKHIRLLMAAKMNTPAAANRLLSLIRLLMSHAIEIGLRNDNPTLGVKNYQVDSEGFHTWTELEVARFLEVHKPGTTAHTAMILMLYTGAARSDAVALGWGNVRDGRISYRRKKTLRKTGQLIDIPIADELAAVLATLPRDGFTFLQTRQGRSRSANGLGNDMRAWCDEAGLPNCTSHGLRKAMARRLAESGATPNMIAAVTGHATLKEVERYTKDANRSSMADDAFQRLGESIDREQTLANHPERFAKTSRNNLIKKDKK